MVKRMGESTRLLYGTGSLQTPRPPAPAPPKTRKWFGVVAAVLCTGALVSKEWHAPAPVAIVKNAQVSLRKQDDAVPDQYKAFYDTTNSFINASADPCVDFYEYACGNWLATHELPSDGASIDASFYAVTQDNKKIIQSIIDAKPPVLGEFYESCVNTTVDVDSESVAYVADIISRIHAQNSTFELLALAGELDQEIGVSSFFAIDVQADPANPEMDVLTLVQGGLTLPSREYYLEKEKFDKYEALYIKYVKDLFAVGDLDKHNVSQYAANILETEKAFATISLTNAELRDPWTTNTPFTLDQIRRQFPYLSAYLGGINKEEPVTDVPVIIMTPRYFDAQNAVLTSIKLDQLKNYLSFHLIDAFGDVLGEYFRRASHDFHGPVRGSGSLAARPQFCVDTTTTYLGTQLGEYYMQKVFGPEAKASAQTLVDQIEDSMNRLLSQEDWLDEATVAAAKEKLQHVRNYIGGPDVVSKLPFEIKNNKFFENVLQLKQLAAGAKISGIGKPVDRQSWDMFASTVNAYYEPGANKMVFPAAILQPPFYSATAYPPAANYARIGMVMGHELSHGFDDQGRNYDAKGTLRKWWTPTVSSEFEKRAQCLAAQYSSFPVVSEGQLLGNVNGNLTLGENIADNGGIHLAYQAYQVFKNATGLVTAVSQQQDDRTFFLAFAQQWCEKRSAPYSEVLRQTDPHSPGHWRVNGPAINFAKFAETFQCAAGTPMNPTNRCVIW